MLTYSTEDREEQAPGREPDPEDDTQVGRLLEERLDIGLRLVLWFSDTASRSSEDESDGEESGHEAASVLHSSLEALRSKELVEHDGKTDTCKVSRVS
jgi:hypothetical protein